MRGLLPPPILRQCLLQKRQPARLLHYPWYLSCIYSNSTGHKWFHSGRALRSSEMSLDNKEALNVRHSRFLAEASGAAPWKTKDDSEPAEDDFKGVEPGKGRLSPTSSHLFKLVLPLDSALPSSESEQPDTPPLVMLVHPSQPLSHVARLILSDIRVSPLPDISFRNKTSSGVVRWSDSSDTGDFIRAAASSARFSVYFSYGKPVEDEKIIEVDVGTFAERTRFMRKRLGVIDAQLKRLAGLKRECDKEAHRGARRLAVGGFGMLIVYWGLVFRLTFYTDLGWDVMEPVTFLTSLGAVIGGYCWFLYQGREISYSSVLDRSVSARREALYKTRGFDVDRWNDLLSESKSIKREISKIAEDYDRTYEPDKEEKEGELKKEITEEGKEKEEGKKAKSDK